MKKYFFAFISLLLTCCSNNDTPYLEIITESDTVGIDETYRAEFHLVNYNYTDNKIIGMVFEPHCHWQVQDLRSQFRSFKINR